MGGITAAFAIAAALYRRSQTGAGEAIDVSMLEATLVAMGWAVSNWLIAGVRRALGTGRTPAISQFETAQPIATSVASSIEFDVDRLARAAAPIERGGDREGRVVPHHRVADRIADAQRRGVRAQANAA